MFNQFLELVSKSTPSLSEIKDDMDKVYEHLGIDTSVSHSSKQITDELIARLKASFNKGDIPKIPSHRFKKMMDEVIYRYVLYEENHIEAYNVIYCIWMYGDSRDNYPTFDNTDTWLEIISCAKDYILFSYIKENEISGIAKENSIQTKQAISARYLISKGCSIEVKDSRISLTDEENGLDPIINELHQLIDEFGGLKLLVTIFVNTQKEFSSDLDRYLITRDVGFSYQLGLKHRIPLGYLINLSVKYPSFKLDNRSQQQLDSLLHEILWLSSNIISALYETEVSSVWEINFQRGDTILELLRKLVLWDSLFAFPQFRPDLSLDFCRNVFSYFDSDLIEEKCQFKLAEFLAIQEIILDITKGQNGPKIIYLSRLIKEGKIRGVIESQTMLIADLIAHSSPINSEFQKPSDYVKQDLDTKPLIRTSPTMFVLPERSMSSNGFYEVLSNKLRHELNAYYGEERYFDKKLGMAIEEYVYSLLRKHNISYHSGDYLINAQKYEADLIIESEKAVFVIEMKKKILTKESRSGSANHLVLDLALSLLNSQIQAQRIEIELVEKKRITIINNQKSNIIELNDRRIHKISLTMMEYGALADRMVVERILVAFASYEYHTRSEDSEMIKQFDQFKKKQKQFINQINRLVENPEYYLREDRLFFDTSFLSLAQLIHIIERSDSNDKFNEVFSNGRNVSMGTIDFYKEFLYTNILKPKP